MSYLGSFMNGTISMKDSAIAYCDLGINHHITNRFDERLRSLLKIYLEV